MINSKISWGLTACMAVGLCFPAVAESTHSEDTEYDVQIDDAGIERIEGAGKFESLSQRLPAVACVFVNSGHSDHVAPLLTEIIHEFDADMHALLEGDEEMGISGGEKNHRVVEALGELQSRWVPFKAAAQNLIAGENIDASTAYIYEHNIDLLHASELVFTEVSTEYANPVLVSESEALLLDFSSRERMLTERIAKEACGVISGNAALGSVADLKKSVATFEAILHALHDGMPSAGVIAAPTEEISQALQDAFDDWGKVKGILADVSGKDSIDHDRLELLFEHLEEKRGNMDAIEKLYAHYAHTHH